MIFNSLAFLLFLPVVFLVYWTWCRTAKQRNIWITLASWFFYGFWNWKLLGLLIGSTAVSYITGLAVERFRNSGEPRKAKWAIAVNLVLNLGVLVAFKYFDFFSKSFADLFALAGIQLDWVTLNWVLPVGISFYTFQALSYTIDIYRGNIQATRNIPAFCAYISFFPQLVAGPIERATNLIPQFESRRVFDYAEAKGGMQLILWGLFKKMLVADCSAEGVNYIFDSYTSMGASNLWLGVFLFTMQIYGDFSGYSDIARGTGRLFGIRLMMNFNRPYFSKSISEFWRRWHISLSSWFRDYLYIPLGGNRRGKGRKALNLTAVFLVSGLWHGANLTFIVWGAWQALFAVPESYAGIGRNGRRMFPGWLAWVLAFAVIMFGWLIFRAPDLHVAAEYFVRMFTARPLISVPAVKNLTLLWILLLFAIEAWMEFEGERIPRLIDSVWRSRCLRWIFYISAFLIIFIFSGNNQQFIYFQF